MKKEIKLLKKSDKEEIANTALYKLYELLYETISLLFSSIELMGFKKNGDQKEEKNE